MPTKDDLQHGTPVRVKMPGPNGVAGYLVTKVVSTYQLGSGALRVKIEGLPYWVSVRDVELIPQPYPPYTGGCP